MSITLKQIIKLKPTYYILYLLRLLMPCIKQNKQHLWILKLFIKTLINWTSLWINQYLYQNLPNLKGVSVMCPTY